jgi:AcrR family transcriptional regulator
MSSSTPPARIAVRPGESPCTGSTQDSAPGGAAAGVPLPGARQGRDPARAIKRGPSRVPPEVVAATQRERLFDGLVHTVAQKGYANARVSDICQAAGVTRPVFYALFASKEDAFLAAYGHGTAMLLQLMEEAYRSAPDWQAGAREALRVLLDILAAVPAFATMAVVEIDGVGVAARQERDQLLDRFDRFFAQAPSTLPAPQRAELIKSVVGGIYSTLRRYIVSGRTLDLPEALPMLSYFMMTPFIGNDAAARQLNLAPAAESAPITRAPLDRAPTER